MAASLSGQRRTVFIDGEREGLDIKGEWMYYSCARQYADMKEKFAVARVRRVRQVLPGSRPNQRRPRGGSL
jgi:hypothetical protein